MIGGWNTIFGYVVFCLLDMLFSHFFTARIVAYMSAMVLGQIIAIVNAYIFHKYITFRSGAKGLKLISEFLRFCTTYIVTFVLSLILLPLFVEEIGITPKIAGAFVILVCTIISYLGHSRFSFRARKDAANV
jgi:putative flippase GtrA